VGKLASLWSADEQVKVLQEQMSHFKHDIEQLRLLLSKSAEEQNQSFQQMRKEVEAAHHELKTVRMQAQETLTAFKEELEHFRGLKQQLQSEFLGRGEVELAKKLTTLGQQLQIPQTEYVDARKRIIELSQVASKIEPMITKLQETTGHIRKEDFDLSKTIAQFRQSEIEKRNLLQKIDMLERLVSGRRVQNQRHPRGPMHPPTNPPTP